MKRTAIVFLLLLSFILFSAWSLSAGEKLDRILKRGELLVGISADQPPLHYKTKKGEIKGLDVDIATLMAEAMGVKLKIINIPFPELLPALERGELDMVISGLTITPQRNLKVAFVGPYFVSGKCLLTKKGTAAALEKKENFNKSSFSIAVLKSSTSKDLADKALPEAKQVITESLDESLDLLLQGRVDAVVADLPFCVISSFRYKDKGLETLQTPFNYEPFGIALPADDALYINWTQNFLNLLSNSGELKNLSKKWFENTDWLEELPEKKDVTMLFLNNLS
jgi:polar amino acid transport system substrate-binding protein